MYPQFSIVIPQPDIVKVPLAFPLAGHDQAFASFMNTWIDLKRKDGTIQAAYDYWILGPTQQPASAQVVDFAQCAALDRPMRFAADVRAPHLLRLRCERLAREEAQEPSYGFLLRVVTSIVGAVSAIVAAPKRRGESHCGFRGLHAAIRTVRMIHASASAFVCRSHTGGKATLVLLVSWSAGADVAFAQAAVTGLVRDLSGAPLPGVMVEAASPVLIERTREGGDRQQWPVSD